MAPYQKTNAVLGTPSRSSRNQPIVALRAMPGTLHSIVSRGCATHSQRRSVVGLGRLELPTSRLSSARSNQLSYKPQTTNVLLKCPLKEKRPLKDRSLLARNRPAPDASHKRKPWRVFVREERETKTAKSRQWSSTIWRSLAPDVSKEVR